MEASLDRRKSRLKEISEVGILPGVSDLRKAVAKRVLKRLPRWKEVRQNGLAGLTIAITELPDGMANSLLIGVNPVYGLYANIIGPIAAGIVSSTQLLTVVTTSAASLTVGESLAPLSADARPSALFFTVLLSGFFQIILGALGAGKLTRFVSYSVMTGFLAGVGCLLVLSQLPTVTGIPATGSNKISQTIDLFSQIGSIKFPTLSIAFATLLLAVFLPRTKVGKFGTLLAVSIPSIIAAVMSLESVEAVRSVSEIPGGIPLRHLPSIPSIAEIIRVVPAALALAAVILIQGTGVSQSVPNLDGTRTDVSRDFMAQGAANVASGIFRGLPVGGSLSATTLTIVAGATRRSAVILAGVWLMAIVALFPRLVGSIAMPSLGALLIVVGYQSVARAEVRSIWGAGWPSSTAAVATFLATLFLPIEAAVALGVVFSAFHYLIKSSSDVSLSELVRLPDGRFEEHDAPRELEGDRVTVLDVNGNLFYAGARTLEARLPRPGKGKNPVVVLRLRGHKVFGATLVDVLSRYVTKLRDVEGRLYLSGVEPKAFKQLRDSRKLRVTGPVEVFEKTAIFGESTSNAKSQADTWLIESSTESET